MPQKLGLPNYLPKDCAEGTELFKAGEYCGSTLSQKYNNQQHNFFVVDSGEHWVLNGGQLDWRVEQGTLVEGQVYDVTFAGNKEIEKGQWKGSTSKNYDLAVYSKDEVDELLKKTGGSLRGPNTAPAEAEIAPEPVAAAGESLEGLE